jgi:hypothetical protein
MPVRKGKLDWIALDTWLALVPQDTLVALERPQMRAGNAGLLTVGANWGGIKSLLAISGLELLEVEANRWTRDLKKPPGTGKEWSLSEAGKRIGRDVTHDGVSDAVLICAWAQTQI